MLLRKLALSALVMLSLSACSSTPSVSVTVRKTPPASCLTQCDPLPEPLSGSDLAIRNWEYQATEAFGKCRRLHSDCVEYNSK